jgi:PAS domain-containing protein
MTDPATNDSTRNSQLQPTISVQRKKTEEDLGFQKNLNERVLNSVSDAILVIDHKDFRIISANAAAFEQLKLDKEELIGKTCYQATHHRSVPCAAPNDVCPIQEMLKTQSSAVVEHQHFDQENDGCLQLGN